MASTSNAALKAEIARLTGAINQHKVAQQRSRPPSRSTQVPSSTRDIVIDGVTFESSSRSLVRRGRESRSNVATKPEYDSTSPVPKPPSIPRKPMPQPADYSRTTHGHRLPPHRSYKSKVSSRTHQHRPRNRNMTLDNTRRPAHGRQSNKRTKYLNKPCPRFTTTGACSRGLTCMYQHDPNKIAICWNFLHGNCPNTAESCNLSHDPIPERTPLCVHFANNGRCTREDCPFPHVRVGQRHGVCRDFAVLGYCSRGLDCQMQHVRECPDFAEKGTCLIKGCKLPHVIRANRNRKAPTVARSVKTGSPSSGLDVAVSVNSAPSAAASGSDGTSTLHQNSVQDAQLGDEYISLMFNESEEESDDDGDNNTSDAEDEDTSDEEEGGGPTVEDGPDSGP